MVANVLAVKIITNADVDTVLTDLIVDVVSNNINYDLVGWNPIVKIQLTYSLNQYWKTEFSQILWEYSKIIKLQK